jgi:hypothetical protein
VSGRPAAGGGRWVEVDPDRLPRWLAGFESRHGPYVTRDGTRFTAADGTTAELDEPPAGRIGLLLARQGAVAVGIATGTTLEMSKVDSRYVQGRTAAGGWSQQRFARRRVNQAKAAAADHADIVARLLLPSVSALAAVVTGGDRRAVDAILADPRLAPVAALRSARFLTVGEPKYAALEAAVAQARAIRIRVVDPAPGQGELVVDSG